MKREISLDEISDGRLYDSNDMVKADCNGCDGCSACCQGMGESVILDPLDIHRLAAGLGVTFEALLQGVLTPGVPNIELHVVDGIILPNLAMSVGPDNKACSFLNSGGRCSIHSLRPGICRLFPLGRYYEDHGFRYFLQIHECKKENKSKVKVRKWIDTPDLKTYEKFVTDWHYFLMDLEEIVKTASDVDAVREINLYILGRFYMSPYDKDRDFYGQFWERLDEGRAFVNQRLK